MPEHKLFRPFHHEPIEGQDLIDDASKTSKAGWIASRRCGEGDRFEDSCRFLR